MRIRYPNYNDFLELHVSVTDRMEEEARGRNCGETGISTDGFPFYITPEQSVKLRKLNKSKEEK